MVRINAGGAMPLGSAQQFALRYTRRSMRRSTTLSVAILSAVLLTSCAEPRDAFATSLIRQKTSAGKNLGAQETVALGTSFRKNELVAIRVQIPKTGFFYAFQADDQGTFDVLYPPASGSPPVPSGTALRLPVEDDLWLGFISSSVTLAWSPQRIESLELAIDRSEVEKDSIRAIRDPEDARKLDEELNRLLKSKIATQRITLNVD